MSSVRNWLCCVKPTPEAVKNNEEAKEARKEVMRVRRITVDKEKEAKEAKLREEKERKAQEALEAEVLAEATARLAKEKKDELIAAKMKELRAQAPPVKVLEVREAAQVP